MAAGVVEEKIVVIANLFTAFDKGNSKEMIAIYVKALEGLTTEQLKAVCKRALLTAKKLPTIAELIENARELVETAHPENKIKDFGEAWKEIEQKIFSTSWGKTPEWSTPEIKKAVEYYGWYDLHRAEADDMPTIKAQIRNIYNTVCERARNDMVSKSVLGRGGSAYGTLSAAERAEELPVVDKSEMLLLDGERAAYTYNRASGKLSPISDVVKALAKGGEAK